MKAYRNAPNTVGKMIIILRVAKKIKSKETGKIFGKTDTYWLWQGFPKSFIIFERKNEAKLSYEKWESNPIGFTKKILDLRRACYNRYKKQKTGMSTRLILGTNKLYKTHSDT